MTSNTPPTVRPATAADLPLLTALAVGFRDHLGHAEPTPAQLEASLSLLLADPSTQFMLAEEGGDGLGYVQCRYRYSLWNGAPEVELEDVFVAAAARRRGVGRLLVEHALGDARRRGCRLACLATNERNLAALALYQGLGFSPARARWEGARQLWLERPIEAT